ncbi:hypothetical protein DASC09_020790 [Saccharomycopsis crataegensis]|uniref:Uncharacterized protein n=1 Tax=Saccharomycopsis crataegensis TaxID=43959 RepID=A0AAV5QK05_9ASCO|nr:hypothetical protein DASC09_020790 [Saccharomycopsis crataegensis]
MKDNPLFKTDPEISKSEKSLTLLDRIYWAYYIHLPFYLMTTGEAFVLHSIMFLFLSFIVYAVGVYLPASTFSLCGRIYYYITGEDLLQTVRQHFPTISKNYFSYIDLPWFNVTNYLENIIN